MPYAPRVPPLTRAEFRGAVRQAASEARITREAAAQRYEEPTSPPAPRPTRRYRRDGWNGPTRSYPALRDGRAGHLTPAQQHRTRHAERV
ncbi:hypothetical protein ACN28C_06525 [Plantactinospora sp. WMMC1484]|uniref:hypothetical protein n=1 Tax=Plantactinospora sp. WMMC1484 TaxID=3404122 RepID=UPI003BF58E01